MTDGKENSNGSHGQATPTGPIASSGGVPPEQIQQRWTSQIPLARLAEVEEVASVVAFLASERASYITGASIAVDGGWIRSTY